MAVSNNNKKRWTSESDSPGDSTLRQYLDIVYRRIWIILAVTVIVSTVGAVRVFRASAVYEATAKVLVERQSSRVMGFDSVVKDYSGWDPDYYTTQASLVRSRVVMEKAIEDPAVRACFGESAGTAPVRRRGSLIGELRRSLRALLGAAPPAPPEPWERLRGMVQADIEPETHFLRVRVRHGDPKTAALVANAAAHAFEGYHLGQQVEALGDAFAFLKREEEKQAQQLRAAETELQTFRENAKGIALTMSDEHQGEEDRLVKLNAQITAGQLQRSKLTAANRVLAEIAALAEGQTEEFRLQLRSLPPSCQDAQLNDSRMALIQAESEQARLLETYGEEHPQRRAAEAQVDMRRKQFIATLQQTVTANEHELKVLDNQEEELTKLYESERSNALGLAKEAFTFTHLKNAVERHRALYDALVKRMLEVDVTSGFSRTSVKVVEEAAVPRAPVNPMRLKRILMFIAMGVCGGAGLAFFFENLDDSVKTPEDLKARLDVPLLGFVPRTPDTEKTGPEEPLSRLAALNEPMSSSAEAYRNIRTSLFYSSPADARRTIAVVSCRPEEGKTTTAVNLAVVIAQSGKKVLLVDCDLHRPKVHEMTGLKAKPGLTSVLIGEAKWPDVCGTIVHNGIPIENLSVMPAGPGSPNPAELLSSQRMKDLLTEFRGAYDWVIVDTPPILFVSDASVISAECEGVVWVIKAGSVHRSLLNRANEQLANVHAHIIGAVLNAMSVSRVGRNYSNYYYHGYATYSKDYHRSYYDRSGGAKGPDGRG